MTVKAATEEELAGLHSKIAKVMVRSLDNIEKAQIVYESMELEQIKELDLRPPELSAPLIGVITKFLNDNKITCVPAESQELSDLATKLEQKRNKRRVSVGNVVHLEQE